MILILITQKSTAIVAYINDSNSIEVKILTLTMHMRKVTPGDPC